jgi:hypothetical protein
MLLQHVARLGLVHDDRPDDRMRPAARIADAQLRQRVDRYACVRYGAEII